MYQDSTTKVYQSSAKIRQENVPAPALEEARWVPYRGGRACLCLARARASTRLNRFATLAPTNMHEAFLLQERGASIFWRRGEGQEAIVPYCQGRNVSIAKGHRQQAAGQCGGKPPCPHGRGSGIRISVSPPLMEARAVFVKTQGSTKTAFLL